MLLVVCPNLATDRILQVDRFQATKVQRSRSVLTQPGGKGSNVARVFRQLGGKVILVGFTGKVNAGAVSEPLRRCGVHVDLVAAYPGETRVATIVCDPESRSHPTVINEETPEIERSAARKLAAKISRWISRVDGVLTTGSLSTGLPGDFYAQILDQARMRGKVTAIDATGEALRVGLLAQPAFMKPNREEFFQLTNGSNAAHLFTLPGHTTLTFGRAGAILIHQGRCLHAAPPRVFDTNPIGAGDAFVAAYLKHLLDRKTAVQCLRFAVAAAASDASTLSPGFIDASQVRRLVSHVKVRQQ